MNPDLISSKGHDMMIVSRILFTSLSSAQTNYYLTPQHAAATQS